MDLVDIHKAFLPHKALAGPILPKTTVVRTPARLNTRTRLTTTRQPGLYGRVRGSTPTTTTELENPWYDLGQRVRQKRLGGVYT